MADLRVLHGVKIVDADTPANSTQVSAAGNLAVEVLVALPTGGNTIGSVGVTDVEVDNAAVSVGGNVFMGGLVFDDAAPVVVGEGDAGYQRMSADREAYVVNRDAAGNERGANVTAAFELNVIASAQPGVDIGDVDVLSVIPGVGATNLGKAESATHVTGDTGVGVWGVRNDAETLLAADGEYIPFMMSSAGRVLVETQGGAGGTSEIDSAVFAPATDSYTPVGGIFDDVTPADLSEGDGGAVRMSAVREMYTNIRDGAGGERSANVTAAFELNVIATAQPGVDIGDVDVLSLPTIVTLADEVDNAAVSVGGGLFMNGMVFDDTTPVVVTEGDAGYQRMSADREAYVINRDAAGNERGANVTAAFELNVLATAQPGVDIGDVDILSGPTGASALEMQGTAADGAAAVGDPVQMGGVDGSANVQALLTDTDGHLQVDVLSGGGEAIPTTPVRTTDSSTDTAAAATFTVAGPESGGSTTSASGFDATASVPIKIELQTVENGAGTTILVLFAQAGECCTWRAPHRDFFDVAHPANAGLDGFQLVLTNLDNENAANLYGTLYTED